MSYSKLATPELANMSNLGLEPLPENNPQSSQTSLVARPLRYAKWHEKLTR